MSLGGGENAAATLPADFKDMFTNGGETSIGVFIIGGKSTVGVMGNKFIGIGIKANENNNVTTGGISQSAAVENINN